MENEMSKLCCSAAAVCVCQPERRKERTDRKRERESAEEPQRALSRYRLCESQERKTKTGGSVWRTRRRVAERDRVGGPGGWLYCPTRRARSLSLHI